MTRSGFENSTTNVSTPASRSSPIPETPPPVRSSSLTPRCGQAPADIVLYGSGEIVGGPGSTRNPTC
ncbi:MAG: hypothetical protein Ct9H300mP32_5980 [Verrucomicrobiota bacterium]|nr:MAG: hypothetical protein Ct9H300mP32_5980 [Verrucomicrobiota bacterium]